MSAWEPSLRVGDLDFCEDAETGIAARGWSIQLLADDGLSFGSPAAQVEQVTSWLEAGWLATLNGWDNREIALPLMIVGTTARDLAKAEQALMLALRVDAERGGFDMTWQPPDDWGDPCVFQVTRAEAPTLSVAAADEMYLQRMYTVTLTALPWVRSTALTTVTVPAPSAGTPTVTSIDACTSTTGWSGSDTPSTTGGAVVTSRQIRLGSPVAFTQWLERTGLSQDMSSSPYLMVTWDRQILPYGDALTNPVKFLVNGVEKVPVAQSGTVVWLDCTGMTINTVRIEYTITTAVADVTLRAFDLSRSTAAGDGGFTARESQRILQVGGAVRTPGSLSVAGSTSLGSGLLYLREASSGLATPTLQDKRTTGPSPTGDSGTISGVKTALATQHEFTISASQVARAQYQLWAYVFHSSTVTRTLTWATRWKMGGTTSGDIETGTRTVALVANVPQLVYVGAFTLPPRDLGTDGEILIRLKADSTCTLDEGWFLDRDHGRLVAFSGAKKRLWVDSPTVGSDGMPGLWTGDDADRSDQIEISDDALARGLPQFAPGLNQMFVVTSGATDAAVTLSLYQQFLTHVVDAS